MHSMSQIFGKRSTRTPKFQMSTLWFHSAPRMISGARYGRGCMSPSKSRSSGNAEPKSQSTAKPKSSCTISRLATIHDSSFPSFEGLGDAFSFAQNSSRYDTSSSGSVSWMLWSLMSGLAKSVEQIQGLSKTLLTSMGNAVPVKKVHGVQQQGCCQTNFTNADRLVAWPADEFE